jgi:hypothetical protein
MLPKIIQESIELKVSIIGQLLKHHEKLAKLPSR